MLRLETVLHATSARSLKQRLADDAFLRVVVGVPSRNAEREGSDGVNNADLAYLHEHGGYGGPARPFMAPSVEAAKEDFKHNIKKMILYGKNPKKYLRETGEEIKNNMIAMIQAGISPGITEKSFRKRKVNKSDPTPLMDTLGLINALDYEIRDTNGKVKK